MPTRPSTTPGDATRTLGAPVTGVPSRPMPLTLPRWAWLLALPLLAGAVLLMHGLDARAGESHAGSPTHVSAELHDAVDHVHPDGRDADAHCETCTTGHVMVACMAIAASAISVVLARRLLRRPGSGLLDAEAGVRLHRLVQHLRPPEPAWVRLAVMRC